MPLQRAERSAGLPSIPTDAGPAVGAVKSAIDTATGIPSILRELDAFRLTWLYRHRGVRLDGKGSPKYQIKEDSKKEGERLVKMARVQAVRDYDIAHQNDVGYIPILTQDTVLPGSTIQGEASLIDDLVRLDRKEMEILARKAGKTTVGADMYSKSDASGDNAKRSVQREIISMGRQSRFVMLEDAIASSSINFAIDEVDVLREIDAKRRALETLLYAETGSNLNGVKRERLDDILDEYKNRVMEAGEGEASMRQIRERARSYAKANKDGDDYVGGANKSEAWRALGDGFKRFLGWGGSFAASILGPGIAAKIGSGNYNEIMSVMPLDPPNFHNVTAHDIPTLLLQIGIYIATPIFLAVTSVGEATARGITDTYQGMVVGTKTKLRNRAVENELNAVAQQEFGIEPPVVQEPKWKRVLRRARKIAYDGFK